MKLQKDWYILNIMLTFIMTGWVVGIQFASEVYKRQRWQRSSWINLAHHKSLSTQCGMHAAIVGADAQQISKLNCSCWRFWQELPQIRDSGFGYQGYTYLNAAWDIKGSPPTPRPQGSARPIRSCCADMHQLCSHVQCHHTLERKRQSPDVMKM